MNNADLDLLIELHKRLKKIGEPLTNEDLAYFGGRLEQCLMGYGVLPTDLEKDLPPKRKWFDIRP